MTLWRREQGVRFSARKALRAYVAVGVLAVAALCLPGAAQAAGVGERAGSAAAVLGWQSLVDAPPFNPGAMFLLTDGTVMVQDLGASAGGSPNWWRLTPDSSGSY